MFKICENSNLLTISGMKELKKGDTLYEKDGFLFLNGDMLFAERSQNSYDFASIDNDGKAFERYALRKEIMDKIRAINEEYALECEKAVMGLEDENEIESALESVENKVSAFFSALDPKYLNNGALGYAFHTASIEELNLINASIPSGTEID